MKYIIYLAIAVLLSPLAAKSQKISDLPIHYPPGIDSLWFYTSHHFSNDTWRSERISFNMLKDSLTMGVIPGGSFVDTVYSLNDSTFRVCKGDSCWNITLHFPHSGTESDPIALAKTVSINPGTRISVVGTPTQLLNANPSWTISADAETDVIAINKSVTLTAGTNVTITGTPTQLLNSNPTWTINSAASGAGLTSLGILMPSPAFTVTPITRTTNGNWSITMGGATTQYLSGNGTLRTFNTDARNALSFTFTTIGTNGLATGSYSPSTGAFNFNIPNYGAGFPAETDPIALAKTVTLNAGTRVSITGTPTQSLTSNPVWTINSAAETDPVMNTKTATLNAGTGISITGTPTQNLSANPSWTINSTGTIAETDPIALAKTTTHTQGYGIIIPETATQTINANPAYSYRVDTLAMATRARLTKVIDSIRGIPNIETDPIANAKNVTLNSGTGISISGTPSQTVGANPTWTINSTITPMRFGFPLEDEVAGEDRTFDLNNHVFRLFDNVLQGDVEFARDYNIIYNSNAANADGLTNREFTIQTTTNPTVAELNYTTMKASSILSSLQRIAGVTAIANGDLILDSHNGNITLNDFGLGDRTGNPKFSLAVDSIGRVIETSLSETGTESDPIALAKTVTLTAGANVSITGTPTQSLTSNPSWTINSTNPLQRFGVLGEDDLASEDRVFDMSTHSFDYFRGDTDQVYYAPDLHDMYLQNGEFNSGIYHTANTGSGISGPSAVIYAGQTTSNTYVATYGYGDVWIRTDPGRVILENYGSGTKTFGTPAYNLAIADDGGIIEMPLSTGGGEIDSIALSRTVTHAQGYGIIIPQTATQAIGSNPSYSYRADTFALTTRARLYKVVDSLAGTGFSETDPIALAKSVTLNAGTRVTITGTPTQILTSNPTWTINSAAETDPIMSIKTATLNAGTGVTITGTPTQNLSANPSWTINSSGITTETDPIAIAKTIHLTAGTNISITGTPTQALNANPTWTINSTAPTGLTSLGIIMPSPAFTVTPATRTTNGNFTITMPGATTSFLSGNGTLRNFNTDARNALSFVFTTVGTSGLATGSYTPSTGAFNFNIPNYGAGFTESDPIANAKTVTLNAGTRISITGTPTQTLTSNPTWTVTAAAETDAIALAKTVTLNAGTNVSITGTPTQSLTANPVWTINSTSRRFGFPLEDILAGEDREFNLNNHQFTIRDNVANEIINFGRDHNIMYNSALSNVEGMTNREVEITTSTGTVGTDNFARIKASSIIGDSTHTGTVTAFSNGNVFVNTFHGNFLLVGYGSGLRTGIPTHGLGVDADGNVIETNATSGSRFAISGEDDIANEDRLFDVGTHDFALIKKGNFDSGYFDFGPTYSEFFALHNGYGSYIQHSSQGDAISTTTGIYSYLLSGGAITDAGYVETRATGNVRIRTNPGKLELLDYGSGIKTGIPTYTLAVQSDGQVIEIPTTGSSGGGVTGVGLTMPPAYNVANSPITTSNTFVVTGAGTTSQYIRGDGTLATLPSFGRFGISGEDDLATQDRSFDMSTNNFSINRGAIDYIQFYPGGHDFYLESPTGRSSGIFHAAGDFDAFSTNSQIFSSNGTGTSTYVETFGYGDVFIETRPGRLILSEYGTGIKTFGTPAYSLAVASDGGVIEIPLSTDTIVGGPGTHRFGVFGEDDVAGQDRLFDLGNNIFNIYRQDINRNLYEMGPDYQDMFVRDSSLYRVAGLSQGVGPTAPQTDAQLYAADNSTATASSVDVVANGTLSAYVQGTGSKFNFTRGNLAIGDVDLVEYGPEYHDLILKKGTLVTEIFHSVDVTASGTQANMHAENNTGSPTVGDIAVVADGNVVVTTLGGKLQMPNYGSGTKTGTPTFHLAVDAFGNVIETGAGTGGSAGNLTINTSSNITVDGGTTATKSMASNQTFTISSTMISATESLPSFTLNPNSFSDFTFTIAGASGGDAIVVGCPYPNTEDWSVMGFASTTNTVVVRVKNYGGSTIIFSGLTVKVRILK